MSGVLLQKSFQALWNIFSILVEHRYICLIVLFAKISSTKAKLTQNKYKLISKVFMSSFTVFTYYQYFTVFSNKTLLKGRREFWFWVTSCILQPSAYFCCFCIDIFNRAKPRLQAGQSSEHHKETMKLYFCVLCRMRPDAVLLINPRNYNHLFDASSEKIVDLSGVNVWTNWTLEFMNLKD